MWRRPLGKKPMERKQRLNWDGEFERCRCQVLGLGDNADMQVGQEEGHSSPQHFRGDTQWDGYLTGMERGTEAVRMDAIARGEAFVLNQVIVLNHDDFNIQKRIHCQILFPVCNWKTKVVPSLFQNKLEDLGLIFGSLCAPSNSAKLHFRTILWRC